MIANLIYFFGGGLTYKEALEMMVPEIMRFNEHADRIQKEEEKAAKKRK